MCGDDPSTYSHVRTPRSVLYITVIILRVRLKRILFLCRTKYSERSVRDIVPWLLYRVYRIAVI